MQSRPRFDRGTSVIAALVFAALLGAVALGLHAFQSGSINTGGLPAQTAPAAQSTTAQKTPTCTQVLNAAVASHANTPARNATVPDVSGKNIDDSCNAAVAIAGTTGKPGAQLLVDPTTKVTYECVGMSGEVNVSSGSVTTTLSPNINVDAGTCSVKACDTGGGSATGATGQNIQCTNANYAPPGGSSSAASGDGNSPPAITPNAGLCGNGATNPPTCDACPSGVSGYSDTGQAICQNSSTASPGSGTPNPGTNSCTNGATDYPTCITCPAGTLMQASSCQPPTSTNPAQQSTVPGQEFCGNGATNPPSCNACPSGTALDSNNICQTASTANALKPNTPGPAGNPAPNNTPNNTNPLNQAKPSTFNTPQTPTNTQQNNCTLLTSILGGCNSNGGLSCQLTVSPNPPQQGMPANLTWTSSGNVYLAQISGVGNVGPSGSYTVYPNGSTNYTMTVYGQNNSGQASCSAQVNSSSLTGCTGSSSCQSSQTPYGVGTNGQVCSAPPPQPDPTQCTAGSWQPVSASGNGCITSYQCGGQTAGQPTAQLSCSPQVADVGMSVALSYSCSNATGSSGAGFTTGNQTSGSTTTVITTPPAGTNTANFGLTCTNGAQASGAQCSVQINQAAIVLVANPQAVPSGQTSSIGWVTAGMQACVISSPQDSSFTTANASNQSINGVAQTDAITQNTEFDLTCTTLGGQTKAASTTVTVAAATSTTP